MCSSNCLCASLCVKGSLSVFVKQTHCGKLQTFLSLFSWHHMSGDVTEVRNIKNAMSSHDYCHWQVTLVPSHYHSVRVDRRQDTHFKIGSKCGSVCVFVCTLSLPHSRHLMDNQQQPSTAGYACLLLSITDHPSLKWRNTFFTLTSTDNSQHQDVPL